MWLHGLLCIMMMGAPAAPKTTRWNFNDDAIGSIPAGFTVESGNWAVRRMSENRVALHQEAKSPDKEFNLVLLKSSRTKDLTLSVHIHALEGNDDLGGGLVWRAKDAKNYYVARYNPLEDNFRVYKVVDGIRTQLDTFDIAHKRRQFTLQVTMKGNHIICKLDGETFLETNDSTFPDAGAIGLWSKSDARSAFDDLILKEE